MTLDHDEWGPSTRASPSPTAGPSRRTSLGGACARSLLRRGPPSRARDVFGVPRGGRSRRRRGARRFERRRIERIRRLERRRKLGRRRLERGVGRRERGRGRGLGLGLAGRRRRRGRERHASGLRSGRHRQHAAGHGHAGCDGDRGRRDHVHQRRRRRQLRQGRDVDRGADVRGQRLPEGDRGRERSARALRRRDDDGLQRPNGSLSGRRLPTGRRRLRSRRLLGPVHHRGPRVRGEQGLVPVQRVRPELRDGRRLRQQPHAGAVRRSPRCGGRRERHELRPLHRHHRRDRLRLQPRPRAARLQGRRRRQQDLRDQVSHAPGRRDPRVLDLACAGRAIVAVRLQLPRGGGPGRMRRARRGRSARRVDRHPGAPRCKRRRRSTRSRE